MATQDFPKTTSDNDVTMKDDDALENTSDTEGYLFEEAEERIRILAGSTETAASFEFKKEDHTLGNALRFIIMKNPDVEFCGYSIPHPSEPLMCVRIQTYKGTTAIQALEKGFDDLMELCDTVAEKFMEARQQFAERMET
ncbi:DNA-directed RNA polymerases I and III subunit RPAC2 [Golovinomyces cichoracearum]|uniref:DNA-directed RNA polymerases I and III subunit RPAC2 n=1 Tax=Golovinomyces cichoracearum TaxID=62708 RepID=A0A420IZM7_9PEZI|nr:DNA-directed RNA polymerases I and III subunit RPAC2 [Golovinomyces cichoracearum]